MRAEVGRLADQRFTSPTWGAVRPERWDAVVGLEPSSILDVGCSRGGYVAAFRAGSVPAVGIDVLVDEDWADGSFMAGDARALPVRSGAFDTVTAFETLEHLPQPDRALAEWHRVTRDHLVLSVPDSTPLPWGGTAGLSHHHHVDRTHVNFFDREALQSLVEAAGFVTETVTPILPVHPFVPALDALGLPPRIVDGLGRRLTRFARRRHHGCLLLHARRR